MLMHNNHLCTLFCQGCKLRFNHIADWMTFLEIFSKLIQNGECDKDFIAYIEKTYEGKNNVRPCFPISTSGVNITVYQYGKMFYYMSIKIYSSIWMCLKIVLN